MRHTRRESPAPGDYERVFDWYVRARSARIGVREVIEWARALPRGSKILDLGCGHGVPIARALCDAGFDVHGIDSSPRMIAAFRANVPDARAETAAVEDSALFDTTFHGVVAWGVLFFLRPEAQETVIAKVAAALEPGGRFLFTAPRETVEWDETTNGVMFHCASLGASGYARLLEEHGLALVRELTDESGNDCYVGSRGR